MIARRKTVVQTRTSALRGILIVGWTCTLWLNERKALGRRLGGRTYEKVLEKSNPWLANCQINLDTDARALNSAKNIIIEGKATSIFVAARTLDN